MSENAKTNVVRVAFQFDSDEPIIEIIEKFRESSMLKSSTEAVRSLIKKGYDQYEKEQIILINNDK